MTADDPTLPARRTPHVVPTAVSVQVDAALVVARRLDDLYTSSASDLGILPSDTHRMGGLRLALGHAYDAGVESADAALTRLRAELAVATAELYASQRECAALHRAMERMAGGDDAD